MIDMLVVGMPHIEVRKDGIYKVQEVATWENNPRIKNYVSEIMITKEAFIEAYNKWIKDPNSSGCEDK